MRVINLMDRDNFFLNTCLKPQKSFINISVLQVLIDKIRLFRFEVFLVFELNQFVSTNQTYYSDNLFQILKY